MEEHCFEVPPRSRRSIIDAAERLRQSLRINQDYFPIDHIVNVEIPKVWEDFSFEVKTADEMGGDHGRTYPERSELWLRDDVYEGVVEGKGRDRFTLAHELGHLLLHHQPGLARQLKPVSQVKLYRNAEWQANSFAGALLISLDAVRRNCTGDHFADTVALANACGVTVQAAMAQLRALTKEGLI